LKLTTTRRALTTVATGTASRMVSSGLMRGTACRCSRHAGHAARDGTTSWRIVPTGLPAGSVGSPYRHIASSRRARSPFWQDLPAQDGANSNHGSSLVRRGYDRRSVKSAVQEAAEGPGLPFGFFLCCARRPGRHGSPVSTCPARVSTRRRILRRQPVGLLHVSAWRGIPPLAGRRRVVRRPIQSAWSVTSVHSDKSGLMSSGRRP